MREKVSRRIARIISGTFHSGVDALESKADVSVLEELTRETDIVIEDLIDDRNSCQVNIHNSNRRLSIIEGKQGELELCLSIAIEQEMDEHAREAISSQMDLEQQLPIVKQVIEDSKKDMIELNSSIEALEAKRREMKSELAEYIKVKATQDTDSAEPGSLPSTISSAKASRKVDQAQETFERIVEKNTGLPSGLSSGVKSAQAIAELQEMSRKNLIEERLSTAKELVSEKRTVQG